MTPEEMAIIKAERRALRRHQADMFARGLVCECDWCQWQHYCPGTWVVRRRWELWRQRVVLV
jgi:hypothetical protein